MSLFSFICSFVCLFIQFLCFTSVQMSIFIDFSLLSATTYELLLWVQNYLMSPKGTDKLLYKFNKFVILLVNICATHAYTHKHFNIPLPTTVTGRDMDQSSSATSTQCSPLCWKLCRPFMNCRYYYSCTRNICVSVEVVSSVAIVDVVVVAIFTLDINIIHKFPSGYEPHLSYISIIV